MRGDAGGRVGATVLAALAPQTIVLIFGAAILVIVAALTWSAIGKTDDDRKFIFGVIGLLLGLFSGGGIGALVGSQSANNAANSVKSQVRTVATQAANGAASSVNGAVNSAVKSVRSGR